jgi:hypothetical protein
MGRQGVKKKSSLSASIINGQAGCKEEMLTERITHQWAGRV